MGWQSRVALVFDTFPPHRDGGAGFLHNLSRELVKLGFEVHVITSATASSFDTRSMPEGFRLWPVLKNWTWHWHDVSAIRVLRRTLRMISPDLVHVIYPSSERPNGYHLPMLLKFLARCPVVTTFFSLGLLRGVTLRTRLTALFLILTSNVLVSHDPFYLSLLRLLSSWRLGRVRYVPVGANITAPTVHYRPDRVSEYRDALALPEAEFYISHFGHVDTSRDVDTLLEAVRRLRQEGHGVRLLMIGGRDPAVVQELSHHQRRFRQQIAAAARELGDAVLWTGFCSDEQVTQYFLASDCTVLPFHRNTFGRSSLAAALQHGMPVITTAAGPKALFLHHGENAMLVARDRPDRLVAALKEVMGSPELRARLAAGALRAAEWYRWERVAALCVLAYQDAGRALGRRASRRDMLNAREA